MQCGITNSGTTTTLPVHATTKITAWTKTQPKSNGNTAVPTVWQIAWFLTFGGTLPQWETSTLVAQNKREWQGDKFIKSMPVYRSADCNKGQESVEFVVTILNELAWIWHRTINSTRSVKVKSSGNVHTVCCYLKLHLLFRTAWKLKARKLLPILKNLQ